MVVRSLALILMCLLVTGCLTPKMDYKRPARYEFTPDLIQKAKDFETDALARLNNHNMLQYRWGEPYTATSKEKSNFLSDGAAWQGYLIAALAFRAAVQRSDGGYNMTTETNHIKDLAGFFTKSYEITNKPGLLCRSTSPETLTAVEPAWMASTSDNYDWVFFDETANGATDTGWCLTKPNKDHVNMAGAGLAIALALDREHNLYNPDGKTALLNALKPLIERLRNDGYEVKDHEGQLTTHPDLKPTHFLVLPEGMNRMTVLQLLAGVVVNEPSPSSLQAAYDDALRDWGTEYAWTLHLTGWWTRVYGHWNGEGTPKFSNPQALAMAALSFLLNEKTDMDAREEMKEALRGWMRFMKYEPNGIYWPVMLAFLEEFSDLEKYQRMRLVIDELRSIPYPKQAHLEKVDIIPRMVQPIHNRPVDSNYWKDNPYKRSTSIGLSFLHFSGVDFLLSYWMGRYFDLIPNTKSGE